MADNDKTRLTANDFEPEVLQLFDQYVHGLIDRRGFLSGAARFAVGASGAAGLLAALTPNFAAAHQNLRMSQRSKPRCSSCWPATTSASTPAGRATKRR